MLRLNFAVSLMLVLTWDFAQAGVSPAKLKSCLGGLTAVTHSTDLNDAGESIARVDRFPLREWSSESQFEELQIPISSFQKASTDLEMKVHFMEGSRSQFSAQAKIEKNGTEKDSLVIAQWPLLKGQLRDHSGKLTELTFVLLAGDEAICEYRIPFIQGH